MNKYTEEQEDVQFTEPIQAQKGVKCRIEFVEKTEWESKADQKKYDATKLTLRIIDESVKTERPDAKPKLIVEDQFNIEGYPYIDKKTGNVKRLGRAKLYQIEMAFGFDPVFMAQGIVVPPFITRSGNKVAPKVDDVKRVVNPSFFNAYYTSAGDPIVDNWLDKIVYCDIEVEESEQFGARNVVARYVKAPLI